MSQSVNFVEYFGEIWKRKFLIISVTILGGLIGLTANNLATKVYESSATLILRERPALFKAYSTNTMIGMLPGTRSQDIASEASNMIPQLYGRLYPNLEMINPEKVDLTECVAILKSREMADDAINALKLEDPAAPQPYTRTRDQLMSSVKVSASSEDKVITVTVRNENPVEAARIANYYPRRLNEILDTISADRRTKLKQFVKRHLELLTKVSAKTTATTESDAASVRDASSDASRQKNQETESGGPAKDLALLSKWLEIEEPMEISRIDVLDRAVPSERPISFGKTTSTLLGALSCFSLAVILVFFFKHLQPATDTSLLQ